jgi:hypothetical protein
MLADPVLGGNVACQPATTVTWQARKRAVSEDQSHVTTADRLRR